MLPIINFQGRSSLGQASKLLIRLRKAFQTNSLWKQTVPPPLLYCVAIRLMSPIQTYFNLSLSSASFGCFLISLLTWKRKKRKFKTVNKQTLQQIQFKMSDEGEIRKRTYCCLLMKIQYFVTKIVLTYCEKKLFQ